ncbi:hypothetical protein KO561_18370 [Radiobacillus kanasensis]|uniref:hypothetical protein n=1 Tax=Radiobacillus kanasensis TaxID=2844358 RepID=UPI001E32F0A4|nr:hypothetical protein [Radiobacillus kanasensis]UFT99120.1 hypothetical protein KO561_18370 [Radiobacillus kanasensis]
MNKLTQFMISTLVISLFLLVGCTDKTEKKAEDENIKTITTVLEKNFTGPDTELKELMSQSGEVWKENLAKYEETHYKPHFANEDAFQDYISTYSAVLWIEPLRNNYELDVKDIQFEKQDAKQTTYDFTLEVEYKKANSDSAKVELIDGKAILNDEHKIISLDLRVKDFIKIMSKS